jgi:hypothetical protein
VGFSKPISVPTRANKTKMVGLLMQYNMIELSLTSGSTGKKITGKPSFDEKAFVSKASPDTKRKLSETE